VKTVFAELKTSFLLTFVLALVLCGAYPLAVWAASQALFPRQANGSLIRDQGGRVRGSTLIGQYFSGPQYFHSRPSAAGDGYDAAASAGTNLGPTSRKLADRIQAAVAAYRAENGLTAATPIPADAVTSSGSGLDPHISPANARIQAGRVAGARHLSPGEVGRLIDAATSDRDWGILGEARVNVVQLNLALDDLGAPRKP
jgi:K+-transporting ATPase ATPase C chain